MMKTVTTGRKASLVAAGLAAAILALMPRIGTLPAIAASPTDLALHKTFVSSDPNSSGWDSGLTDGLWVGGKGEIYATGRSAIFPKTVTVDLAAPESLGYVAVGVPDFGSTKTVDVSLSSDGMQYSQVGSYVFSQSKAEYHLYSFPATTARYVRLTYADHYDKSVKFPVDYAFTSELSAYAPGAKPTVPTLTLPLQPADVAAPKLGPDGKIQATFEKYHESFLARAKQGPIGLLFLGDSITRRWDTAPDIYNKYYSQYQPANFGIGGDKTQHVLWRIDHGELDGIHPKVVVLMIGTNNILYPAADIVKADTKILAEIHQKLPDTKVLLLGIFPRSATASDPWRAKIKQVNTQLAKLDDGDKTRYLDIGDDFLNPDGTLKGIRTDHVHPTPEGYQIWADAMNPLLTQMMK